MIRELRRAAVVGLSAGLVLTSLAGCSKKEKMDLDAAAVTVNDTAVSVGVLNFAVRYDQANLESAYMSFGISDPFNQDLFGQGQTMGEMMKSEEAESLMHMILAEQHMDEYDVAVTDEDKAAITDAASEFMSVNTDEVLEEIGATQEIVERYLELRLIQHKMEKAMTADVDTEVSDEEAAQRSVQYVLFTPVTEEETEADTELETTAAEAAADAEAESETSLEEASLVQETLVKTASADETEMETEAETTAAEVSAEVETEAETEDPETAEAMARALVQAEEFLTKVAAGEDFDTVAEEMNKTASTMSFGADYFLEELVAATDGLEDDTLVEEPVKTDNGYYVLRVISQFDREATDAEKENIVNQRKNDRITELYEEWEGAGEVSQDAEVISKIVFDYYLEPYAEPETEAESEITPAETEA